MLRENVFMSLLLIMQKKKCCVSFRSECLMNKRTAVFAWFFFSLIYLYSFFLYRNKYIGIYRNKFFLKIYRIYIYLFKFANISDIFKYIGIKE